MSLKRKFSILCLVNVALCLLLSGLIYRYGRSVGRVDDANTVRLQSIMLANEIRQSSDDLTRLGRTYVVTGDPKFKQHYSDILDIRSGKKPRPQDYYRVYWDFISAGLDKPRPDGEAVSVQEMMRRLGFSQQETDKLAEAVRNSDGLVRLEVEAMNLVEGKDSEGRPLPAPQPGPDRERAIGLVHSPAYHGFKAQIMKPLDDFYGLIEHRTDETVRALQGEAQSWFLGVIAALVANVAAFLALAAFGYAALLRGYASIGAAMERIAAGDYATAVPGLARKDEVGAMARSLDAFKTGLADDVVARHEAAQVERERERRAQNHDLAAAFETAVGAVVRTVTGSAVELRETAQSMAEMAGDTAERSKDASRAAADASGNAATLASAAEELGASVTEIGRRVADAAALTRASSAEAGRTATLVKDLNTAATRVGDVVAMISGVASQTNLLALNATIEAARAGEAGRGFAVVAAEVKELANQTARATDEIATQIAGIQGATHEAVSAIAAIVTRIDELDGVSSAIAAAVEQQGATTQEIVRNVAQAAGGAGTMRETIGGVASLAGDTGAAAAHVLDIAAGVSRQADQLDAELARLLAQLRAA